MAINQERNMKCLYLAPGGLSISSTLRGLIGEDAYKREGLDKFLKFEKVLSSKHHNKYQVSTLILSSLQATCARMKVENLKYHKYEDHMRTANFEHFYQIAIDRVSFNTVTSGAFATQGHILPPPESKCVRNLPH